MWVRRKTSCDGLANKKQLSSWNYPSNGASRILPEGELGHESVHVDVAVILELLGKLWSQLGMRLRRKVSQSIGNGELKFSRDW